MQHIDTALLVGCYIAIIALYVWVFRTIEEMKEMLYRHQADACKHVESKDLVYRDVCAVQVKRFEENLEVVKDDVREVKDQIKIGFDEVKVLIKEKHT